jgi:DNA helicase-2/ATP-dependent DNA helicase PcrA
VKQYGVMSSVLDRRSPAIRKFDDKLKWTEAMDALMVLRESGTVGDVINHLRIHQMPRLSDAVEEREVRLERLAQGEDVPRSLAELQKLKTVSYREISALARYLDGHTPFETKHGVKGAEFENVLVVLGRGWNQYNFEEMLELAADPAGIPAARRAAFERNRNLFYVVCSRPRTRLALLFTQQLSDRALAVLSDWFGAESIKPFEFA